MAAIPIEHPHDWSDYELIDSGNGKKLERFGDYTLIRPEPRIIWSPSTPESWKKADATFVRSSPDSGNWDIKKNPPNPWTIRWHDLIFTLKPTEFKHTGVFPEQAVNWNWIKQNIQNKPLRALNLFAYTGGATMAALSAGAYVTHLDSVKSTIAWARENIEASKLDTTKVRFIEDDAYKFVLREARRGNTYDGIIMDPPRFGRGSKGEVWKLGEDLPKLMQATTEILSSAAKFVLLNAYTADFSAIAIKNLVADTFKSRGGETTSGELALQESLGKRLVPQGIFVRHLF